jgi:hypothetical protein
MPGLGWFDAIAPALTHAGAQIQKSRQEEAELARQQQMDALRMQLLQTQIAKAQEPEPAQAYQPTTYDEAVKFYGATHPAKPDEPIRPEWVDAGFPDEQSYLDYLGRKSKVQYPERFSSPKPRSSPAADRTAENEEARGLGYLETYRQGRSMGSNQGLAQANSFHEAYQAIRRQHPEMTPGRVASQAFEATKAAHPELFRSSSSGGGSDDPITELIRQGAGAPPPEDEAPAAPPPAAARAPAPPAAVTTPTEQTAPAPAAPKRTITQDQADYLRSIGRWDPELYEVR